jgi:phytoene desaturase
VRVAVIGAGLGGLSCAARLARAGYAVDLFEQGPRVGGKADTVSIAGFRFDTGPSLLTLVPVFDQLFAEAGERRQDWVRFIPLAPICHYFYPDGTVLYSYADRGRFGAEVEAKTADSAASLARYLDYSRTIYELTADLFLWHSLHEPASYLRASTLRTLLRLGRIDALRSMDAANRSFFRDPRLVQFFDRYATYNGSDPYRVPATLNIIPHVEYGLGGYAVEGGIYALPAAIGRLAEAMGARLNLNTRVERILLEGRRVRGVAAGGRKREYEVVVSNVDALRTYRELLGEERAPLARRYARLEPSSSGIVFLWGMKRAFPELGVNNIFFSRDYRREFRQIFLDRVCPEEPTVYVNITSKVTPEDAPAGGENWFVLVNAPYDSGQDWPRQALAVRQRVLERLQRSLGRPVSEAIACEEVLTPVEIERRTGSTRGSLYGIASNTALAAFLRHPNRVRRLPGLYLCGGSVHPGGGMPLAVLSGKIAADLIRKDRPAGRSGA